MSVASEQWAQMRVRRDVHERLLRLRDKLAQRAKAAPEKYPPWLSQGQVSLAEVIQYLIFKLDQEECRQASYRASKRCPHKGTPTAT